MTKQQRAIVNAVRQRVEDLNGDGYSLTDLKVLKTLQRLLGRDTLPGPMDEEYDYFVDKSLTQAAAELVREQELAR